MRRKAKREPLAMNEFTLEEAVALIYRLAVLDKNAPSSGKLPDITQLGLVCGVLTMNDQIEVVVKFHDEIRQYNKEEFENQITLLES
jgi:hypothetical protein